MIYEKKFKYLITIYIVRIVIYILLKNKNCIYKLFD